ncbi:hypothetical protein EVAR_26734_1 [Eumeta japonica]|uniref:Uncharacterized protein n=1 Tax=Eumeta variegata TaxID=151549 RepID=A0A4C1XBG6_EUMVA|nr:hypothetical protein EVAR_26734_1 [Eumeta japonica]
MPSSDIVCGCAPAPAPPPVLFGEMLPKGVLHVYTGEVLDGILTIDPSREQYVYTEKRSLVRNKRRRLNLKRTSGLIKRVKHPAGDVTRLAYKSFNLRKSLA